MVVFGKHFQTFFPEQLCYWGTLFLFNFLDVQENFIKGFTVAVGEENSNNSNQVMNNVV